MKKRFLAAALSAMVAASLVACGGTSNSAPATAETGAETTDSADEKVVSIAIGAGFSTLDPGQVYEKYPPTVVVACYETLFKFYTNNTGAEPCLADAYEFSEDGKDLTVTLRSDAVFASGNPVTSADVVFSINRLKNLQGNPAFIIDTIESVEATDDQTVVFHLTQADSGILSKLCYSATAILDSEVVKANGGTDAEDAATKDTAQAYLDTTSAGSGQYIMTSYTPDEEIVLEKNPNYYKDDASNVDKFIIKIQPDSNTQMMTLAQGDLDIAMNMTDDTMAEIEGAEGITLMNASSKTVGFIMMNMDEAISGPCADPDVQEAIKLAVDYAGIQTLVGQGTETPYNFLQTSFPEALAGKDASTQNIEEAKKLLADAGYEDGFDIDLTVCDLDMEGVPLTDLAQKVADDLAQIGIKANIVSQPWAAGYGDDYRDGKLGLTVMYWGIDYNDANVQLAFLPGQTVGLRAGWTEEMNPELAAMVTAAEEATDLEERASILAEAQELFEESAPFVFIAQAPVHVGYNSARLENVETAVNDAYAIDPTLINVK